MLCCLVPLSVFAAACWYHVERIKTSWMVGIWRSSQDGSFIWHFCFSLFVSIHKLGITQMGIFWLKHLLPISCLIACHYSQPAMGWLLSFDITFWLHKPFYWNWHCIMTLNSNNSVLHVGGVGGQHSLQRSERLFLVIYIVEMCLLCRTRISILFLI